MQKTIPLEHNETMGTLFNRTNFMIADCLIDVLKNYHINDFIESKSQPYGNFVKAPKTPQNIFVDFKITNKKRAIISSLIMSILTIGLVFLTKETKISIIPVYMKEYISGTISDADLFANSISMWKIVVILFTYGVVQEYIFRKHLASAMDESTLLDLPMTVVIMTIVGAVLDIICFSVFSSGTFASIIYVFIGSLIYQGILNINYFYNKQSLLINVLMRILLIIGMIVLL